MKKYNKYGLGLLLTSVVCWSVVLLFLVGLDDLNTKENLPVKPDVGVEQDNLRGEQIVRS